MKQRIENVIIQVLSFDGTEAKLECPSKPDDQNRYFADVTIKDNPEVERIFGIDPLQAVTLGLMMIEHLTEAKRIQPEHANTQTGCAPWTIGVSAH